MRSIAGCYLSGGQGATYHGLRHELDEHGSEARESPIVVGIPTTAFNNASACSVEMAPAKLKDNRYENRRRTDFVSVSVPVGRLPKPFVKVPL